MSKVDHEHQDRMRKYLRYILRLLIVAAILAAIFYYVRLAPITVSVVAVKRGPVEAEVMGAGTLWAHTEATISPDIQGRLVELTVDENDKVTKDQLLARLDDSDLREQQATAKASLEAAQAAYQRAQANQKNAEAVLALDQLEYDRQAQLRAKQVVSESTLDQSRETLHVAEAQKASAIAAVAEAQKQVVAAEGTLGYQSARLAKASISSPFAGLITRRDRNLGDIVVPGTSIYQLISTEDLWVSAWVDESFITALKPGQKARIVFRSTPPTDYRGSLLRISHEVDQETREFLVDVVPEELPARWAVGERAEVFIITGTKDDALRIPGKFVRWRGGRAGVWVDENGKATWRNLELGMRGREFVEVTQGLAENDKIIVATEAEAKQLRPARRVVAR